LKSAVLSKLLSRCEKVTVFTLTIGSYLEELVAHLAEERLVLQATVLDAIGSGTAEKLAKEVEEKIKKISKAGSLVTSRRFSPGYCDWKVDQQEMLFRALNGDTGGVKLTDSFLMMPRKSVSGIIGIGRPGRDIENYNPCVTCKKKECPGRRK
jgi:cobalamin-dependent methionine synthase I